MLQADVVLDFGATETACGVEVVQILVGAVAQGFPDSRVEVDSLDRPWFRFATWSLVKASLESLVADSLGMDQHLHFGSRKAYPFLLGMNLLEDHDISFRRNEFLGL